MGAVQSPTGNGSRYRIVNGKLAKKVDEEFPGAVRRDYEDKKTREQKHVFEKLEDAWFGKITSLTRVQGGDYGEILRIGMSDETEQIEIEMMLDSGYALDFLKRYLSPDFKVEEPCTVQPFAIPDDKGTNYYFTIVQGERKCKSMFTKEYQDNPAIKFKLPNWEKIDIGAGKVLWNKSKQIEFLWTYCVQKALKADPMFKSQILQKGQAPAPSGNTNVPVNYTSQEDYMKARDKAIQVAQQQQQQPAYVPTQQHSTPPPATQAAPSWDPSMADDDLPF